MPLLTTVAVRSVARISPSFLRLELGGDGLADFGVDGPVYDQRFKLLLPGPSGLPVLSEDNWWAEFCALPVDQRGAVRTYTIRDVRGEGADTRLVVDVVLHPGAHGPGSDWAASARVGDEAMVCVPRRGEPFGGIEWNPAGADRLLLVADETAVPAACSILSALPGDARGSVFLEVPDKHDVQEDITVPDGVSLTWLPREGAPVGERACTAVSEQLGFEVGDFAAAAADASVDLWETPHYSASGEPIGPTPRRGDGRYAWIAGESGMVKALRRYLVNELEMPRSQVCFMGYWRQGVASGR